MAKAKGAILSKTVFLAALAALFLPAAPVSASEAVTSVPTCKVPAELTRLDHALSRTMRKLASGDPLRIVAIGSSSTAGAGASSPAASYPSRLEAELKARYPRQDIVVVNRGVNGERANEMLARFDSEVIVEKPDLVLWQVGSNSVLRDDPIAPAGSLIREGVAKLKAAGTDVVLVNPQFAPRIISKHDIDGMLDLIDATAKQVNVGVFRRFSVMRHWKQVAQLNFDVFLSPDELHLNDWSYDCVAKLLAASIVDASTRPTTVAGPQARP
jgi:acyl-CoA thioesterase-1